MQNKPIHTIGNNENVLTRLSSFIAECRTFVILLMKKSEKIVCKECHNFVANAAIKKLCQKTK